MFSEIVTTASGLVCLLTLLSLLIKPVREWLLGIKEQRKSTKEQQEGIKCLLRAEIIRDHSHYMEKGYIPIYAMENVLESYAAYHSLGGNGTITKMVEELKQLPTLRG